MRECFDDGISSSFLFFLLCTLRSDSHSLRRRNRCEVRRWNLVFSDFRVFSNRVGKLVVSTAKLNI